MTLLMGKTMTIIEPNYTTEERRAVLQNLLQHETCNVTFTKVNGEVRTMPCTLQESVLPARDTTASTRPVNNSVLSVWCIDKQEWRSFKVDSVTHVEIL